MRDIITTVGEVAGAVLISVGMGIVLGLGASLIVAGIFTIVGSVLEAN